MASARTSLRARWVFPVDRPPLRDGVVEFTGNRIAAVRPYRAGEEVRDLGDVALLPGLVNAHTHLEFSDLERPLGEPLMAFPDWIRLVIEHRRSRSGEAAWQQNAVVRGLAESAAAGVALLGEIAPNGLAGAAPSPKAAAPYQVVFAELLGLSPARIEPLWNMAEEHVAEPAPADYVAGLSPHATYTVHPELLSRVCQRSHERGFPVAMHVAESLDEIELLLSGSGQLVKLLDSMAAFPRGVIARGTSPLRYLETLAQAARALVIHGNYLSAEEIAFLGERSGRMSVVYCPRTHAYFNAGDYPLAEMLAANVNVCLGTDSRASNPELDLFEELRFVARRYPRITLEGILHLGTQAGADALGLGAQFGSLSPGKQATLLQVRLASVNASDPHELLFADGTRAAST